MEHPPSGTRAGRVRGRPRAQRIALRGEAGESPSLDTRKAITALGVSISESVKWVGSETFPSSNALYF